MSSDAGSKGEGNAGSTAGPTDPTASTRSLMATDPMKLAAGQGSNASSSLQAGASQADASTRMQADAGGLSVASLLRLHQQQQQWLASALRRHIPAAAALTEQAVELSLPLPPPRVKTHWAQSSAVPSTSPKGPSTPAEQLSAMAAAAASSRTTSSTTSSPTCSSTGTTPPAQLVQLQAHTPLAPRRWGPAARAISSTVLSAAGGRQEGCGG